MNKYEPLWRFVSQRDEAKLRLSFDEIERILGFTIDHSFLTYKKEAKDFGIEVGKISLKEKTVTFLKKEKI